MHFPTVLGLCALAYSVNAAPAPTTHSLHEKRASAPLIWEKRSRVDPSIVLPVRIGLTQSNLDNGPDMLDEV